MYMHINEGNHTTISSEHIKDVRYCLNASLRKACRVLSSLYAETMHESELQGTQFTLLSTIAGFGEVTIGDLSDFLSMDQTTVTRSVHLLRKSDYVEIVPGEDQRIRVIRLTERGQETLEHSYPMWLEAQTRIWEQLGDDRVAQLFELSNQIVSLKEQK